MHLKPQGSPRKPIKVVKLSTHRDPPESQPAVKYGASRGILEAREGLSPDTQQMLDDFKAALDDWEQACLKDPIAYMRAI